MFEIVVTLVSDRDNPEDKLKNSAASRTVGLERLLSLPWRLAPFYCPRQKLAATKVCSATWIVWSFNWPSDVIWRHSSGSTLVHVMAWCLTEISCYPNQFWLNHGGTTEVSNCNRPVSQHFFSQAMSSPNTLISSWIITTNCWLYSNISYFLLLYKTWGYYNKFDSTKSLGVCY